MAILTVTLTDPESVSTALRALTALSDAPQSEPAREQAHAVMMVSPQNAGRVESASIAPTPDTPASQADWRSGPDMDPQTHDIHGLVWDAEIHSSPPRHNADGSWRARKGRKAEYDAAVEAARAAPAPEQAVEPEPQGIPADREPGTPLVAPAEPEPQPDAAEQEPTGPAQPAAPAPTTPEPPVDYEQMARRFMAMMTDGKISDFNAVYQALSIDYNELETNQTMIAALWAYMEALDNGEAHDGAVRHALGSE